MTSLLSDFAYAVARHPDRIAIIDGKGRETTFRQLQTRADGLARAWAGQGIQKGDRVLLAMSVDADLYASLAALWSLGATVVLPEPAMGVAGLRHAISVAGVTAFCSSGLFGLLKIALPALWRLRHLRPNARPAVALNLPAPDPADIALISFTSGTSGAPKAIPRSHAFLSAQHLAITPLLNSEVAERDLVAFPVFVLINIASGRTSVLPSWKMSRLAGLDPETVRNWITAQSATRALLPPALVEALTTAPIPTCLHTVFTGGGPVFPDVLAGLTTSKPSLRVVCVYGSTEAEPIAHLEASGINARDHAAMEDGQGLLVGAPVEGLQVRIVADEIQVAGAHVNGGYLNPAHDAENKVRDGDTIWHRTGDAGYFDDRGRLWLLGRAGSQVSVASGSKFPFQIEVAARGWDGVVQCALIALDDVACLVVEGDTRHLADWRNLAAQLDITEVRSIAKIPMDKRHASKIDRKALLATMR